MFLKDKIVGLYEFYFWMFGFVMCVFIMILSFTYDQSLADCRTRLFQSIERYIHTMKVRSFEN